MNALVKAVLAVLAAFWAAVAHPGHTLKTLMLILKAMLHGLIRLFSLEGSGSQAGGDCCLHLDQVYRRPDPLLYSQPYLMAMGLSVTWDNPDIQLFEPGPGSRGLGAPVSSEALQPDHLYRVQVQVWNGSYDAPAVGLPVTVTYLDFGIGTANNPVGVDVVDLGVKGSSACPASAVVDWRTPAVAGHYCLQARLDWADDANPSNNLGQENTNVLVAHSPAHTSFTIVNQAAVERRFVFEVDGYRLPALEACAERSGRMVTRLQESTARWEEARARQGLGNAPLPADWSVTLPDEIVLVAGGTQQVDVAIEPPLGSSRTPVNVHVFALRPDGGRDLAGGVTLYVESAP